VVGGNLTTGCVHYILLSYKATIILPPPISDIFAELWQLMLSSSKTSITVLEKISPKV